MSWKENFRRGVVLFKQDRYKDALEAFNQAARENDKDATLLDSRAAVLEKLDRPLEALKDSKKVIDLKPTSWQGYARSARLFLKVGKPEASLKMTELALERIKDTNRRAELEDFRKQVAKALESPACYFSGLPVELQTEIFSLVIDGSNAKMLRLTLVCRSWRDIIINTPRFWRSLTITHKTRVKKADTWLQRSRGILTNLHIAGELSFDDRSRIFKYADCSIWSKLDRLKITTRSADLFAALPASALDKLRLLQFEVDSEELDDHSLQALSEINGSRMHHFSLKTTCTRVRIADFTSTSLTTLALSSPHSDVDLFLFLKSNPMLENLVLESPSVARRFSGTLEDIELHRLVRLELINSLHTHRCLQNMRFPNVRTLIVKETLGFGIGVPALIDNQRLTVLEHLTLSMIVQDTHSLVSILRRATPLKTLQLTRCCFEAGEENTLIEALTEGTVCPKLQHVDLSRLAALKAGPVIKLVKAHSRSAAVVSSSSSSCSSSNESQSLSDEQQVNVPLPVLSLNLDDCPMIDSNALPWFRAVIPNFSCRMTPVKMGRGMK
ncbi:uncharacterized protein FOMMEDRAFT_168327 [Fomitiporia mediterranea MF3/22]|uniref:uncharacterized protein n=1 Tax=Fomitiporia mediterranea (strain MF3/22) TaxID=694068 RepID=UPI0004409A3A|nr:uncharacterized protein FOMMEDRAFT_168327 [Fomitiporia mediterranea MF3/22]EJD03340.1 hypothetical protein FOMMEDRAFT_168327 [Fomitiporia mediterranea MF3/22]